MKPVSTSTLEACLQQLITERGESDNMSQVEQLRDAVKASADLADYIEQLSLLGQSMGTPLPFLHIAIFTFGLEMGIRVSELMQLEEMAR